MTFLTLRLVVTVLCAISIVVAGAVALTVSLSYTLSAAEQYATQYVSAISETGKRSMQDFLSFPLDKAHSYQYAVAQGRFALHEPNTTIADRVANFQFWIRVFYAGLEESHRNLMYYSMGLEDQSYFHCTIVTGDQAQCRFRDALNLTAGKKTQYDENINATTGAITSIEWTSTTYNPKTRPWYTAPGTAPWARVYTDVFLSIYAVPVITLAATMHGPDGTMRGVLSLTFRLDDLSRYLLELPRTANAQVILLDNSDYLLGSTQHVSHPVSRIVDGATEPIQVHSGCLARPAPWTGTFYCPYSIENYTVKTFAQVKAKAPSLVALGASAPERLALNSGQFYASARAVVAPGAGNMNWRVLTVIPESDITDEITTGRNMAIIFVAVTIVVCTTCALLATWLLLRPLGRIALRMYQAATFQAVDEDADADAGRFSALAEVATIQRAFATLADQVRRARQYLPASLLAPEHEDADEDEGGVDGCSQSDAKTESTVVVDETGSPSSRRPTTHSHSSSQQMSPSSRDARTGSDSLSVKSHKSNTTVKAARAAVTTLRSDLGLARRRATILYVNVRGFNARVVALGAENVVREYGGVVDVAATAAQSFRGILDSFHGDRFVLTFNAARTCASHASSASAAAASIVAAGQGVEFTCGLASGLVSVGNLGSSEARRFHTVGDAFSRAVLLERLCKTFGVPVLGTEATAADATLGFHTLYVDAIPCAADRQTSVSVNRFLALVAIRQPRDKGAGDEWMYEIAPTVGADGNANAQQSLAGTINDAMQALLADNPDRARALIADAAQTDGDKDRLLGRVFASLQAYLQQETPTGILGPQHTSLLGLDLSRLIVDWAPSPEGSNAKMGRWAVQIKS